MPVRNRHFRFLSRVHYHRHPVHDSGNFLLHPEARSLRLAARLSKPANTGNNAVGGSSNDTDVVGAQRAHHVVVSRVLSHIVGQAALVDHTAGVVGLRVPRLALDYCYDVDVQHDPHHDFAAVALARYHLVLLAVVRNAQIRGLKVRVHGENWRLPLEKRSIRIPSMVVCRRFGLDVVNINRN